MLLEEPSGAYQTVGCPSRPATGFCRGELADLLDGRITLPHEGREIMGKRHLADNLPRETLKISGSAKTPPTPASGEPPRICSTAINSRINPGLHRSPADDETISRINTRHSASGCRHEARGDTSADNIPRLMAPMMRPMFRSCGEKTAARDETPGPPYS